MGSKSQLISRMCKAKTSFTTQPRLLNGAATEEVKRLSGKRKLGVPILEPEPRQTLFDFGDIYDAISPESEPFPSLSWDLVDEDVHEIVKPTVCDAESSFPSRKRPRTSDFSGMVRSKSFRQLSALNDPLRQCF